MSENGKTSLKLKIKPRVVLHTQNRPTQMSATSTQMPQQMPASAPPPPPAAPQTIAGFEELVMSGHILGMSTSVQNDRFCLAAYIQNNPEIQFIGQGANAEEALADLKVKVLELGLVI